MIFSLKFYCKKCGREVILSSDSKFEVSKDAPPAINLSFNGEIKCPYCHEIKDLSSVFS